MKIDQQLQSDLERFCRDVARAPETSMQSRARATRLLKRLRSLHDVQTAVIPKTVQYETEDEIATPGGRKKGR